MRIALSSIQDPGFVSIALANGDRVVVIRRGDFVTALADGCPHQAMPLSAGELCDDGTIECPWHGARFDCTTGECRRGPATDAVRTYACEVDGGEVVIDEG